MNNQANAVNVADVVALFGPESDKWPIIYDNSFFINKFMNMNYLSVGLDTEPYLDMYVNSKIISNAKFINVTGSENENLVMKKMEKIRELARSFEEYRGDDEFTSFGNSQFVDWDDFKLINLNPETNRNELYNIVKNLESLEILKINSHENIFWILNTVIECGFLPSLIYAKFPMDDSHNILTNAFIGNLRNLGYSLLCNFEGKCLLYLGEPLVYTYADCTEASSRNPLVETIIKTSIDSYKQFLENPKNRFSVRFRPFKKLATVPDASSSSSEACATPDASSGIETKN